MPDRIGQQLGKYRLIELLGSGGFADVYLAEHLRLGSQAAIKVLRTHITAKDIEHFQQEARIIAGLLHPHIIRVLDFDVEEGTPFLVLDYAPNGSLRQLYPKGTRLSLQEIIAYVQQIAAGLQYAHDQKLIHRDIKPENMLIGRQQDILLSDFGIATIAHNTSSQRVEAMAGTIFYMSPEQIQGKPRVESDQYALAVMVYEWLCGKRPFTGTAAEIAMQHTLAPVPSLRDKLPGLSVDVENVLQRALAKDFRLRFESIQAFAQALERASLTSPPPSTTLRPIAISSNSPILPIIERPSPDPAAALVLEHAAEASDTRAPSDDGDTPHSFALLTDLPLRNTPLPPSLVIPRDEQKHSYLALVSSSEITALLNRLRLLISPALQQAIHLFSQSFSAWKHWPLQSRQEDNPRVEVIEQTKEDWLKEAVKHINLRWYEQAISAYDQAILLDPKDANTWYCRGFAYFRQQKYENAIKDYSQAIVLHPTYFAAYYYRGFNYEILRQYEQAINDYSQAMIIVPSHLAAHYRRGLVHAALKQYEQAISDYSQAVEIHPGYIEAYQARGFAYRLLNQQELAINDYSQIIAHDPLFAPAYQSRGNAHRELQHYEQAISDYNQALSLDPQNTKVSLAKQQVLRLLKNQQEGESE